MLKRLAPMLLLAVCFSATLAHAQTGTLRAELMAIGTLKPPGIVAATVDGEPIDVAEVNRLVKITLRGRPVSKTALAGVEAQALEQVISRRLVKKFLEDKKIKVTEDEIDDAIRDHQKKALAKNGDLADDLGLSGLTLKSYRDEVEWELRWGKYLRSEVTDKVLQQFFEARRQEFDGTELRLSQILLRPNGRLDPEQIDALLLRAETIRDEVLGELTTFADAAKRYSSAPSRTKGGDIGFIPRRGVMPDDFNDAAFELEKGQISRPVVTHLGVHLIECTDVRPGKKTWRDVRRELRPAVMQDIFERLAAKMRETVSVEYTGDVSYFDSEKELVKAVDEPATK
jgi:parvulin-like peptidyl-prolyl isomerase